MERPKNARVRPVLRALVLSAGVVWLSGAASAVLAQGEPAHEVPTRDTADAVTPVPAHEDSVTLHLVDVDLRAAIQALSRYLDKPVVFGNVQAVRVTLETPQAVPRSQVPALLRGVLQSQHLELISDSAFYHVEPEAPKAPPAPPPETRTGGPVQLYVIHLQHARAADVSATVNALYGHASAVGEIGAPPPTLSEQLRRQQYPPGLPAPMQNAQQPAAVVSRSATLTGDLTIIPDAATNSLLIRATAADFELIEAAVKQLDVRPLQVLIEVLIAEVRRDRSWAFGLGTEIKSHTVGKGNTTAGGSTSGLGLGDFVLSVMKLGGVDLDATLAAAAARGDVTIVSRPVVIAANNEPASILVGSQRPFVQVVRALPTDAGVRDQVIQYRDVGTKLIVQPTISSDGYVMLQITQEVNAATNETQFDAPIISTRSVQTQLLIKDGQTIALGGLSDKQRETDQSGVPVLSSIPVLGGLFGRASHQTTETELFLFLTPRVIRSDAEADSVTQPLRERAEKAKP